MDIIYTVNPGSETLQWGTTTSGALSNSINLGFACHRIAVMPDQKYLYITGNKPVNGETHAWLAVVDTCGTAGASVVGELDLGEGFAGQCAMPPAPGTPAAYVAISKANGNTVTQGRNRLAVLDVANPAAPQPQLHVDIPMPNGPYGTLHVVWSDSLNMVYTSHRGDGKIFSLSPSSNTITPVINTSHQPMGLGLSLNGHVLFVARRLAGDIEEYDLLAQPAPNLINTVTLPYAITASGMYNAVDSHDRVYVTSSRPTLDPNNPSGPDLPADGFLNVYQHQMPPAAIPQITTVDTQGTLLGQTAINPDATVAYVPRGGQNDMAQVDLANMALQPAFLATGNQPTDAVVVSHVAALRLVATPASVTTGCNIPTPVTIQAFDACDQEISGVNVQASTFSPHVHILPPTSQATPATFRIECLQGGPATVNFTATIFPFPTGTVSVQCQCLSLHCYDFGMFQGGPLPVAGNLAGVIMVSVVPPITVYDGVSQPPRIIQAPVPWQRDVLRIVRNSLLFQILPPHTVDNLTIRGRRFDLFSPREQVTVTHAGGTDTVPGPICDRAEVQRSTGCEFDIVCPFTGITQWILRGGLETEIEEICFFAAF